MEIAVVGSPEFTLGFQLAGISTLFNPEGEEETSKVFRDLLTMKGVAIVVLQNNILSALPERLRDRLSESVTPTVLGIGTEEDLSLIHI